MIKSSHEVSFSSNVDSREKSANPVNSFDYHTLPSSGPTLDQILLASGHTDTQTGNRGSSSPEEVASPYEQSTVKLKMLIQQVLQEMADGTI
jgi:hypothetical protein